MNMQSVRRFVSRPVLLGLFVFATAACTARVEVSATGAAPAEASQLWITVKEIWFATAPDAPPGSAADWVQRTLPAPVTLDLATLTPGTLVSLAGSLKVPGGSYHQVHLVLAESTDALSSSASSAGLPYNAGIGLTQSSGVTVTEPLELAVPGAGVTLPTDVYLSGASFLSSSSSSSTKTLSVAVALDQTRDVLSYAYGSSTGYLLNPVAGFVDQSLAGAITGQVDASALPAGHPAVAVSAETISADGTHHVIVMRGLAAADGSFALYPLPVPSKGSTQYDVVIACAGADTVIVRGVTVSAGTASSSPTALQSGAIALTPAPSTVYADLGTQNPVLPAGTRVTFYETIQATGEVPYMVDGIAIDPLTRRLPGDAFALAAGPLLVGSYSSGQAITFSQAAPSEGEGYYVVGSDGPYKADALASAATKISGTATVPTTVAAPVPALASGLAAGSLQVSVAASAGRYDSGFLIVTAGNRVLDTASVGSVLAAGGGTVTITGLPVGNAAATPSTAIPLSVGIRAWNSGNPASALASVAAAGSATIGSTGVATLSVTVP